MNDDFRILSCSILGLILVDNESHSIFTIILTNHWKDFPSQAQFVIPSDGDR